MAKVLVPLAEGFEEVEALTVVDVLRRGGQSVVVAAIGDRLETKGAHGITVVADALFADVSEESYSAIVLPGGAEGTERLGNSDAVVRRLQGRRTSSVLSARSALRQLCLSKPECSNRTCMSPATRPASLSSTGRGRRLQLWQTATSSPGRRLAPPSSSP